MFKFKTLNLLRSPYCKISQTNAPGQIEFQSTLCIRLDTRQAKLRGWYRLKLKSSDIKIDRLFLSAIRNSKGRPETIFDARLHTNHVGGYIFLSKEIQFLELKITAANSSTSNFSVTLRPISKIEQTWLALRSETVQILPANFIRLLWPTVPYHFDFKFGGFYNDKSERAYRQWIRQKEQRAIRLIRQRLTVTQAEPPPISILMPVCDPSPHFLLETIRSVKKQTSKNWQLCIADDASTNPEVIEIVCDAARDPRISVVSRSARGNISAATNSAFALTRYPFVFCLDHDDLLAPQAVELFGKALATYSDTQVLYSDEDIIDFHGNRRQPVFKPDFSPDLLRSHNYINHISLYRADSIRAVGGWRTPFDGAQDYDLLLRIIERADLRTIRHLPLVLYHWRASIGSTALSLAFKPWASEAGRAALEEHIRRSGIDAEAKIIEGTHYRVVYEVPKPTPRVSIVIPFRDRPDLLRSCVNSIFENTVYNRYDILLIDNGSVEQKTARLLDELRNDLRIRILTEPGPFNFSALNNRAAAETDADFICFLNNDTHVISPDWLSELIGRACQPWVGCVGPRLLYEDGTIQHAGVILGLGGVAGHAFVGHSPNAAVPLARLTVACNYSALTAACLVIRRSLFLLVGGFDETDFPIVFNDIDLCLKLNAFGFYNSCTPFSELYHYESSSRKVHSTPDKLSHFNEPQQVFAQRYGEQLWKDPFYSPHYSLSHGFTIDTVGKLESRINFPPRR